MPILPMRFCDPAQLPEPHATQLAVARVKIPYDGSSYRGLRRKVASGFGIDLCRAAAETGCFKHLPSHLIALIAEMERDRNRDG